jgi:hypothetical protein
MENRIGPSNIGAKELMYKLKGSKNPKEIGELLEGNMERVAILAVHPTYLSMHPERLAIEKILRHKAAAFEIALANFFRPIRSLDNAILVLHPEEDINATLLKYSVKMAGEPAIIYSNDGGLERALPYELTDAKRVLLNEIEVVFALGLYLKDCLTRGMNATRFMLEELGKGNLPIIFNPVLAKEAQEMR